PRTGPFRGVAGRRWLRELYANTPVPAASSLSRPRTALPPPAGSGSIARPSRQPGPTGRLPVRTVIVIPARYASTRLPGKPLLRTTGKFLVEHVYEQA